ncbi:MAG: alpha-glycosidase [Oscillospiraceae bacterium]|nr:alpha-glycosidase [Oscillospiraceae bacterium]
MEAWLESVYSDGTLDFVSAPAPRLGQTVTLRLRCAADAPVDAVLLRSFPNGAETLRAMEPGPVRRGLRYYETELRINEPRVCYQFCLVSGGEHYFYTQRGISSCLPGRSWDFRLLADYVQPAWVKEAVFYQIFPERFCNGDPANDVREGEYAVDGHPTLRRAWTDRVLSYEEGRCLDFYGGDLEGIRRRIPYLQGLGVTALYLNPIFRAPSVHKYDCVDYFHVDPHFGGDEALARLSAALHEAGMKLILDISINHTGSAHRWFNRDCLWFDKSVGAYHNPAAPERDWYFFGPDGSYKGWWGIEGLPVLNYRSESLRDVIYRAEDSVLKKWLKPPYSIDGWRFDVADVFARNDEIQLAHELWPQIRRSIKAENPQAYILAEDWGDCSEYLRGDEWDSPMNYWGCGRPLRQFVGQGDFFLRRNPALARVRSRITAPELEDRVMQYLAKLPFALWENQFNLLGSHDIGRLHNDPAVDPGEYRGAVMLQFLLMGAPSVYYGDEAEIGGEPEGNEGCRWPMPWDTDFEAGERFRFYQGLIALKRRREALRRGGMKFLCAEGGIVALARFTADEALVAVVSTEDRARELRLPLAALGAAAPAGERDLFGTAMTWRPGEDGKSVALTAMPHTAYLFDCEMRRP